VEGGGRSEHGAAVTTYTTSTSTSQTLTPSSADTIQFTAPWSAFKLTNRGADTIWFRTDGSVATVAGANCRPVLPSQFAIWVQFFDGAGASTRNPVSLISSAADAYTVEGVNIGSADAALGG